MSAPITAERLAEIEARANAATEGPWRASTGRTYDTTTGKAAPVEHYVSRGDDDVGIASDVCDSRTGEQSEPNALFIAHARTDVPALVAEVRRLTAALAAHARHTDAAIDGVRAMLPAALEIARREGAEAMRERCDVELDCEERRHRALERDVKATLEERAAAWERGVAIESARVKIAVLPLDVPGGEG